MWKGFHQPAVVVAMYMTDSYGGDLLRMGSLLNQSLPTNWDFLAPTNVPAIEYKYFIERANDHAQSMSNVENSDSLHLRRIAGPEGVDIRPTKSSKSFHI